MITKPENDDDFLLDLAGDLAHDAKLPNCPTPLVADVRGKIIQHCDCGAFALVTPGDIHHHCEMCDSWTQWPLAKSPEVIRLLRELLASDGVTLLA